ncbi:hypothetical protein GF377_00075 [candidate division GN15 bacterium]|nr:hypothetical protein [candidate division GN15 bacterium]
MNLKRLKQAEAAFLKQYPGGFEHPQMVEIGKRHKVDKMQQLATESFAKARFKDADGIVEAMIKTVTQSSLVSVFEKPKFRDMARSLSPSQKETLAKGLKALLHGSQKRGFETILGTLADHKMAKWTLMTVVPAYYRPDEEVFVKPSTTKSIIKNLELDLVYKPTPTWEFYETYRDIINNLKTKVSRSLSPSNPAFCGFMMFSFD